MCQTQSLKNKCYFHLLRRFVLDLPRMQGSLNKASCQLQHTLKNNSTENNWDKWYLLNSPVGNSGSLYSFYTYACSQFSEECSMTTFQHTGLAAKLTPMSCFSFFTTYLSCLRLSELSWLTPLHYDASKEDDDSVFFGPLPCFV